MVEAITVGIIVSFYEVSVVLQAFFLTASVVVGLTLFTFQTKRDFSGWGAGYVDLQIQYIVLTYHFNFPKISYIFTVD